MFQNHAMLKATTEKWAICPPSALVPYSREHVDNTKCIACNAIALRMNWLTPTSSFLSGINKLFTKTCSFQSWYREMGHLHSLLLVQMEYWNCALNGTVELQRINMSVSQNTGFENMQFSKLRRRNKQFAFLRRGSLDDCDDDIHATECCPENRNTGVAVFAW